jgi:sulfur-oxidizing protein SoxY
MIGKQDKHPGFSRRGVLGLGAGLVSVALLPLPAFAAEDDMRAAQAKLFGDRPINVGKVKLKVPPIAENGYSVPVSINVDSPMTSGDYVKRIAIFSPRNPVSHIADFELGPRSGKAEVSTRVRLGGSQILNVIAEMNDGSLWSGTAEITVTLAACIIM